MEASDRPLRLRARWVVPVIGPIIQDGEVVVESGRIAEVRSIPLDGRPVDGARSFEGEVALLPGLVNVHAHIDYTVMRGLLEDMSFFPWIRALTERKAALEEADWIASATMGAAEAAAGGVTTLGDCTDSGAALLGAKAVGLRGIIYQETFSLDESEPVEDVVQALRVKVAAMRWAASGTRLRIGISPHAPYTIRPQVIGALAEYAASDRLPVCIHAAESIGEAQLLRSGTGEVAERFERRGLKWLTPPPGLSSVAYLNSLGALGQRTLLVHGVQLSAADCEIITRTGAAWAHCPKSNAKLGNGVAPLRVLRGCYPRGESRVGLGSDSVASNNTMDLFEEMRFALLVQRAATRRYDAFTAEKALRMATIDGARALGMERQVGSLEPGKQADVIAVRLDGLATAPCHDPVSTLVYSASARDVLSTMVAGEEVYGGRALHSPTSSASTRTFRDLDLGPVRDRFMAAGRKLREWDAPA